MHQQKVIAALLMGATTVSAEKRETNAPSPTTTVEACAQVSSLWAAQIKTTPTPTVAASLANDCLNSVPLNQTAAIELIDAIEPYLEWQSDAAYKAHPPEDYYYPPYDLFANLAQVRANVEAGLYENEISFQGDLYQKVFAMGHDGHYVFYPDAMTKAFRFQRTISLVSVSDDGHSKLPVIKVYEDLVNNRTQTSVVESIDGVAADKYILDTAAEASFNQDIDAAYNSMFFELGLAAAAPGLRGYFNGFGRINYKYHGATTSLTFANGTTAEYANVAGVFGNMTGVTDGASFYKVFCTPKPLVEMPPPPANDSSPPVTIPNYPKPVIQTTDGIVSGYFLEGDGFENVAVIALLAFENDNPPEFQAVCQEFFKMAAAMGKTKLVIDMQGNGGGLILQGYDFFGQLFPRMVPDGYSRWKAGSSFLDISRVFSAEVADLDPATSGDADAIADYLNSFDYHYDLNLTDQSFRSFDDKFAPRLFQDTPYTALMRWNLTDPLTTKNETFGVGFEISGTGSLADIPQPFRPEDIVLVYDGVCASTCVIASEMLRIQGNVKSVAFGGRPMEGPIQGVGGVKGAEVLQFSDIYDTVQRAINITGDEDIKKRLARFSPLPMQRSSAAVVNARDQILRDNVKDGLPAQYVVENADCRLYWTEAMVKDIDAVWKAAADAAFNGAKCAHGGISREGPSNATSARRRDAAELATLSAAAEQRLAGIRGQDRPVRSSAWGMKHRQRAVE